MIAEGQHTASLKSVDCFLTSPSCFLLLLMSGNVHSSPGLSFFVQYAGYVNWRGRSVQCCTWSNQVHLRFSLLSFSRFKTLDSSHSWSCLPCCVFVSSGGPTPTNTVTSFLDFFSLYISTVHFGPFGPLLLTQCSCPTFVFKLPLSLLPTVYLFPILPFPHVLAVFLYLLLPLPPLTRSGFFNKILKVFEPGALNYCILSRLILWVLSISRNPTLTRLPPTRSLDFLLCNLIALASGLVLSPHDLHAGSSIIIFVRQDLPFYELFTSSLSSLGSYSDYVLSICSSVDGKTDSFPSIFSPS